MSLLMLVLFAADPAPARYVAQVATYGCNSSAEVHELEALRTNADLFQKRLYEKSVYGQCVLIAKGALVEGTNEKGNMRLLRIDAERNPPGFMVPAEDFKAVR